MNFYEKQKNLRACPGCVCYTRGINCFSVMKRSKKIRERGYTTFSKEKLMPSTSGEWKAVVRKVNELIQKLQDNPDDIKSTIALELRYT